MFIGWLVIADCSDGRTMLSPRVRVGEELAADCRLMGVMGRGGDDEDVEEAVASEFLDLAFPLLYIPGGTVKFRNTGSWSTVGMLGRSEYVKYAVRCHFLGFASFECVCRAS